jgi:hypothetical protein
MLLMLLCCETSLSLFLLLLMGLDGRSSTLYFSITILASVLLSLLLIHFFIGLWGRRTKSKKLNNCQQFIIVWCTLLTVWLVDTYSVIYRR